MERQYIWFRSGRGLIALGIGLVVAILVLIGAILLWPGRRCMHCILIFLGSVAAVGFAVLVDRKGDKRRGS